MNTRRKICIVTGSRADYGLLYWVMKEIDADPSLQLQLLVTGMHLSPEFGRTDRVIEADGFTIDRKIETLLSSDTPVGVAKSVGLGVIGIAEALAQLAPDWLLVLGDRFEILAAVQAALFLRIPVAHIAGGDTTEGAFDESIRHAISKMAHLHLVTNPQAAGRLRQMGENPANIHVVGSPGLDTIRRLLPMSRVELEQSLDFRLRSRNLLVTFHPVTLANQSSLSQLEELFAALDQQSADTGILFTLPNADTEGRSLIQAIQSYVQGKDHLRAYPSLGQRRYLSLMREVDAVLGNSSSGLYEAPSFKIPTINIGERQQGRLQAASVINCAVERTAIATALSAAATLDCKNVTNPYGDGHSAERIIGLLKSIENPQALLQKHFFEQAAS